MTLPKFLAPLCFAGMTLLGQQPSADTPKVAKIEGTAVSTSGAPVPRARIRISGAPAIQNGALSPGARFEATTDDAGKFVIDNVTPGNAYTLTAEKPGFVTARYGARPRTPRL